MSLFRSNLAIAALASLSLVSLGWASQQGPVDEYRVKAAFLVTFAKFVTWPSSDGPLVLGIVGDNPFGPYLETSARTAVVNGRRIVVRQLQAGDKLDDCEILFISGSPSVVPAEILRQVGRTPVLTVGESPRFLRDGGMIRLMVEDDRVRFQINSGRAEEAGLRVNAQLLSLAVR